jgi:hypothetical protein
MVRLFDSLALLLACAFAVGFGAVMGWLAVPQ